MVDKEERRNKRRDNGFGKRALEEVGSTATLVGLGIGLASRIDPALYKSMRESAYNARHAGRTVGEIFTGTEGEKAVETLLKANYLLRDRYRGEIELVDNLANTYRQNETLAREVERLGVQLKGMIVNMTAVGDAASNKATGGAFKKIDDWFMNLAGKGKADAARENLPKLQEIYEQARKFYDGREKSEKTIKELSDYLGKVGLEAVRENESIRVDLNRLGQQLDRTYVVENEVFNLDDRVSFLKALLGKRVETIEKQDISKLEQEVKNYRDKVDETRTGIEQHTGIPAYREPAAWIDSLINPVTLGIAVGLAAKGVTSLLNAVPYVGSSVRKVLALPVTLPVKYAGKAGRAGIGFVRKRIDKLKNPRNKGNARENQ